MLGDNEDEGVAVCDGLKLGTSDDDGLVVGDGLKLGYIVNGIEIK